MRIDKNFLLQAIREILESIDYLTENERKFAQKIEQDLLSSVELLKIYETLVENAEHYDYVCEELIEKSIIALGEVLQSEHLLFYDIIKLMIRKAEKQFKYYPFLLTSSIFIPLRQDSFVELNQNFADQIIPELTGLLASDFYHNNFFALNMGNKCFNDKNKHLGYEFESTATRNLSEKKWEIRQQTFYVLQRHGFNTENIKRSFWDKLSWPYFLHYRKNKTWL